MMARSEVRVEGPPLKPLDRLLRRWRFATARRYLAARDRILDVGCSDGALFRYLAGRFREGVGLDPALQRSVDLGRVRLIAASVGEPLSVQRPFDAITMLAVIEHLPEPTLERLGSWCAELLRPGGRVVITVPAPAVDAILDRLQRLRLIAGVRVHEHHGFDPEDVSGIFPSERFELLVRKRFELGLNNLFVFRRP
jgi:2-polyprenyl-3-methyl-5-hydroxy-6-metoxy-1,4-benzoquinol methylase